MSSYRNKRPLKLILWSSQCKFWSVKPSTSPFLWPNLGKTEKNQIRKICTAAPSQLKAIAEKQGQHVEWLPLIIILMNIGNNYYFQWILIQCTNSYLQPPFRGANTSSAPCTKYIRWLYESSLTAEQEFVPPHASWSLEAWVNQFWPNQPFSPSFWIFLGIKLL